MRGADWFRGICRACVGDDGHARSGKSPAGPVCRTGEECDEHDNRDLREWDGVGAGV
jgi:hypothetical protein